MSKNYLVRWLYWCLVALVPQLGAAESDWLGSSYSECVVKNLQNVENNVAAANILSVCFEEFCGTGKERVRLDPSQPGERWSKRFEISTHPAWACDNYRDEKGARRIKSHCTNADFIGQSEDRTCPYRID